jgi:hypothetical protein
MMAAINVGCRKADTVPIPASDATPPTITLDAYGIPLQQGASSQDNPETINASCCALSRHLRSRQTEVSLVATGTDVDGGVQNVRIVIALNVTCQSGEVRQSSEQYGNPDSTPRTIGANVGTKRTTNVTFKASKYCGGLPQTVTAVVNAEVVNFSGGAQGTGLIVRTPGFTLLYP